MRFQTSGNKPEVISLHGRAAVSISRGLPVCLSFSGTEDGFEINLPSNLTLKHTMSLTFGICVDSISVGNIGEVQVYGFCRGAILTQERTRSNSGVNWASLASLASLGILSIDTVNNGLVTYSCPIDNITDLPIFLGHGILLEDVNSIASVASVSTNTLTISQHTSLQKVFLRMM